MPTSPTSNAGQSHHWPCSVRCGGCYGCTCHPEGQKRGTGLGPVTIDGVTFTKAAWSTWYGDDGTDVDDAWIADRMASPTSNAGQPDTLVTPLAGTRLWDDMNFGHRYRKGHQLRGVLFSTDDGRIWEIARSCCGVEES